MSDLPKSILICDDDSAFRRRLGRSLRDREISVYEAENAANGLEVFNEYLPEGVIVDLRMPGESGLWLVKEVAAIAPRCRIVVLTGFGSIATALEAVRRGAVNYITKPATIDQILGAFILEHSEPEIVTSNMPSLAEVEAEYVQRVLDQCDGNVSRSAKILGVHRRSLQRKLRR
jgi:two-component system response regulator RegA